MYIPWSGQMEPEQRRLWKKALDAWDHGDRAQLYALIDDGEPTPTALVQEAFWMALYSHRCIPWRMEQCMPWVRALDAWDHGDPTQLADLIGSGQQIPTELAGAVADIIAGRRPQNKKAIAKLRIPAGKRMGIAQDTNFLLWVWQEVKDKDGFFCSSLEEPADSMRVEVIDLVRELEGRAREMVESVARHFGVSVETIENLLRDFREKIKNWPVV